jgi:hypothetical protein
MDDEDEMENEEGDVGSPSPPFEGVIKEEAEKQLESQGGDFERRVENFEKEVNNFHS